MRTFVLPAVLLALLPFAPVHADVPAATAPDAGQVVPAHGVIGIQPQHLEPAFWISRHPDAGRVLMDAAQIEAHNAALLRDDPALHDLSALPQALDGATVDERIGARSALPDRTLYDGAGSEVASERLRAML